MATPVENVLLWAIAQKGDRYVFGAEANASDPDPDLWDCSELIEWACARAGVSPRVPDGAFNQWRSSKDRGLLIPVEQGVRTRGAALWVGDGVGTGRGAITHVALSLGDGRTIEARGSKWGVGSWPAAHRFDFAGLFPGVDYTPAPPPFPVPEEPDMAAQQPLVLVVCHDDSIGELKGAWFKTNGVERAWVPSDKQAIKLRDFGLLLMNGNSPFEVGPDFIRELEPWYPSDNHPGQDRLHHDDT